jgi:chemotaxis response regulator CheB
MTETTAVIRVLHVDDAPAFGELTATFLEREDDRFVVETATSVDDAFDHLDGTSVDCIVSDYEMPGSDGIEFLEAVREEYPDLPFVLFTGRGPRKWPARRSRPESPTTSRRRAGRVSTQCSPTESRTRSNSTAPDAPSMQVGVDSRCLSNGRRSA